MAPPLMGYFMSGYIIGHIKVLLRMGNPENESSTLRKRDCVCVRLCESRISREFQDAQLTILVRAEIVGTISECVFHTIHHSAKVIFMPGIVIDFQVHLF